MVKVQNPIIGRSRGSAGGMTFCKNYDKNVARAKAFEVNNPKTPAQQNQRAFFKQVANIVATVTDEELRSLFGIKPKAMSRRNALSRQVSSAFGTVEGQKVVDFSKLLAIGNGEKVNTPIFSITDGVGDANVEWTLNDVTGAIKGTTNVIVVFFNTTKQSIELFNCDFLYTQDSINGGQLDGLFGEDSGFAYCTCAKDGENVNLRGFGSFIIKTRGEEKGRDVPVGSTSVDVEARRFNLGDSFSFDLSGTIGSGGTPSLMTNAHTTVASRFTIESPDEYSGEFSENVDTSSDTTLTVQMPDESEVTLTVNFVQ